MPSVKFGTAESLFIGRGIYNDYISQYMSKHATIATKLESVAADLRERRLGDERFIDGGTYLVLDEVTLALPNPT